MNRREKIKNFIKSARMKRWDFIIIVALVGLSFAPWAIFAATRLSGEHVTYTAVLRARGQKIKEFPLENDTTYNYQDADGDFNVIEVKDGQIRIKEADCGDQVCVRQGWISRGGQSIICLPHQVIIEVIASDGSQEGSVIY